MTRVALIGNAAGGKSTLARRLAAVHSLPLHHVDRMQFGPSWSPLPETDVRRALDAAADESRWIIDGWGPWPTIERRFALADTLIWIDLPLWVHFWWAAERQIAAARGAQERPDGPDDDDPVSRTRQLFETIWAVDQLRPRLAALIERFRAGREVHHLRTPEALDRFTAAFG
jgi:hypothetical protein